MLLFEMYLKKKKKEYPSYLHVVNANPIEYILNSQLIDIGHLKMYITVTCKIMQSLETFLGGFFDFLFSN